jgi:hypothetical protein
MRQQRSGTRVARGRGDAPARPGLRAGWNALLLAVLLAFSWQSFVTQTHQHFDFGTLSATAKAEGSGQTGQQSPLDQQDNCPICRGIAHAGAYLLPAPIALNVPVPVVFWLALATIFGLSLTRRSHAWQSRAPPHQLQA